MKYVTPTPIPLVLECQVVAGPDEVEFGVTTLTGEACKTLFVGSEEEAEREFTYIKLHYEAMEHAREHFGDEAANAILFVPRKRLIRDGALSR